MNIKIANRLVELRKKSGLSQEQLADKLGLSRQAVSKWERAEASPDTDNLICLAKLYNVSLDELLSVDEPLEEIVEDVKMKEEGKKEESTICMDDGNEIHIKDSDGSSVSISHDGIFIEDGEDSLHIKGPHFFIDHDEPTTRKRGNVLSKYLWGFSLASFTIAYIVLGLTLANGWASYWPLFFFVAAIPSGFDAFRKKSLSTFLYPLLVTGIYCFLGSLAGLWHPYWFLFLSIPVYYAFSSPIDKAIDKKHNK